MDLNSLWPLPGQEELRDRLLAAYDDPARGYHDRTHLTEVLDRLTLLRRPAAPGLAVVLAAWFHDAVYDGTADDEERSAALAERELGGAVTPEVTAEVARLVRLTSSHRPAEGDPDGELLCDADLAILAADEQRYAGYVAGVRREFAHVDDDVFRAGRAAVLRDLLAKRTLFHTQAARGRWEQRARANLARELGDLEG